MFDVEKLTDTAERLTNICDALLTLIQMNRTAAQPTSPTHGYEKLWSETKERIEELQLPPAA